jgi:hypothetical protein
VGLTPGEIKAKTPRIHGFVKKFSIMYWGRRLDTMGAVMLYEELPGTVIGASPQLRHQVAPVQTYHRPGFLNPWNPWNPWPFCLLAQFALKAVASY